MSYTRSQKGDPRPVRRGSLYRNQPSGRCGSRRSFGAPCKRSRNPFEVPRPALMGGEESTSTRAALWHLTTRATNVYRSRQTAF